MVSLTRVRKQLFYGFMVFVSFISILLFSEVILRVLGDVTTQDLRTASQEVFDDIPGMFEPGQDFMKRSIPQLPHHISINSFGYRGPEVRFGDELLRILCIGDSFTFGDYVSDDETFPYSLQKVFEENAFQQVEVINGGVGGATIVDELYFLKKSMRISPRVVVLTFYENDIKDLSRVEPMYLTLARNRELRSGLVGRTVYGLVRNSALFAFGVKLNGQWRNDPAAQRLLPQGGIYPLEACDEKLWKMYEAHLREMQRFLYEGSTEFMLAIYPSHHRWTSFDDKCGDFDNQPDRLEHLAKDMGIATLNLLPELKRSNVDVRELYLLPYDGHASKEANRLVANAIFRFIQEKFPKVIIR